MANDTPPLHASTSGSSGTAILVVTAVLIPVLTILVATRLYLRYKSKMKFGLDDFTLILSWTCQMAWGGIFIGTVFVNHSLSIFFKSYLMGHCPGGE